MENIQIDYLVAQKLQVYDNLEKLSVSNEWEKNLILRLENSKRTLHSHRKQKVVLAFLTITNLNIILFSIIKEQNNISNRAQYLNIITSELLIPEKN